MQNAAWTQGREAPPVSFFVKISQEARECGRIGEGTTGRARVWQSATGEGDNFLRDVLVKWKKKRRTSLPKGETYADESQ